MPEGKGTTIQAAHDILHRTYSEIERMSDEVGELLADHVPNGRFTGEYSYSPS